jgi:hypothetical protein
LNADGTHSLPSVVLVKIDVDKHAGISDELRITSLPTTMTMRDGKLVDTVVGAMSPAEAEALVAKAAAPSDDQKSSSSHETNTNTNPAAPPSPADLVDRAFALLDAPSASESAAAAAADLLNAALASESALPPAAKARAYAAAARCALLARPPDVPRRARDGGLREAGGGRELPRAGGDRDGRGASFAHRVGARRARRVFQRTGKTRKASPRPTRSPRVSRR